MDQQIKAYTSVGKKNLIVLYLLYLCGIVAPMLPIVGVVFAYIHKDASDKVLASHYIFLLRTFFLACVGFFIATLTMLFVVGMVLYFGMVVWYILRIGIGFKFLLNNQAHPNPKTLWIQ